MGNNDSKKNRIDPDDKNLDHLFDAISNKKGIIHRSDLKKSWSADIDPKLYNMIELLLFKTNKDELNNSNFKRLHNQLYKGDLDDKVDALAELMNVDDEIPHMQLLELITSILRSVISIQRIKNNKNFKSWSDRNKTDIIETIKQYGDYFLSQISSNSKSVYDKRDLRNLLLHFEIFLNVVFSHLYKLSNDKSFVSLYPRWRYNKMDAGRNLEQFSLLDLANIIFLNSELPIDFQNEWRLLFSTQIDGESFSRLSQQIINQGPTIMIIKDKKGHIFGGFASHNWNFGPKFVGDASCFLFTLYPHMDIFSSSNFNENFQYLNVNQQTMPNGLGMGGRLEYFGLWLDAEFGSGYSSESCTTFRNYKMMSSTKNFEVSHVEVWGVGLPPPTPSELGERSVLDSNLEAKAILEMAGKQAYSEGLREDPDDVPE